MQYCYWHVLDKGFKFELYICYGFHDLIQMVINCNDALIASVIKSDYRIYFWYMIKDDFINIMKNSAAINIMKNYGLNKNSGLL